jgi:hypothetical protein
MRTELIFVLGCGRSGSTLLERVMHDAFDVTALGEVTYVWEKGVLKNESCGCGLPFRDCPFWSDVIRDAFGHVTEVEARRFDLAFKSARGQLNDPALLSGRYRRTDAVFIEVATSLYRSATRLGGSRPILDSSKSPAFAAAVHALKLGPLGGLHIFRDACGNVQSLRTPKRRPHASTADDAELRPSRSILHAIGRWSALNWESRQMAKRIGETCATISYERFCENLDQHLGALQSAFDLSPRRGSSAEAWHSVSGNPMRYDRGGTHIHRDDRWKATMKPSDCVLTRMLTGFQQRALESAAQNWFQMNISPLPSNHRHRIAA